MEGIEGIEGIEVRPVCVRRASRMQKARTLIGGQPGLAPSASSWAIGSRFTGGRALVSTSGSLMVDAIGMATPLVGCGCDPNNLTSEATMGKMDPARLRALLEQAAEAYPEGVQLGGSPPLPHPDTIAAEIRYLEQHGLIEKARINFMGGPPWHEITAQGIDFLSDDGGLSAVLGVITVRFEAETMRALLIARAEADDSEPTVREHVLAQLRALPASTIQQMSQAAVAEAIRQMPNAVRWLYTQLGP